MAGQPSTSFSVLALTHLAQDRGLKVILINSLSPQLAHEGGELFVHLDVFSTPKKDQWTRPRCSWKELACMLTVARVDDRPLLYIPNA